MSFYLIQILGRRLRFALALFLLAAVATAWPQSGRDGQPAGAAAPAFQKPRAERRISEKDAQKLFATIDEILRFASADSKLPIQRPVERKLFSREQLREFMAARAGDDGQEQRARRSEAVLKKLGLLPRDFDLPKFLADLQEEQVLGFYDTRTATVCLLDWVEPGAQRSVLAHELMHALQDQMVGLEAWLKEGKSESGKEAEPEAESVEFDEQSLARRAVAEGQAMHVLLNYVRAAAEAWAGPSGSRSRSLQSSPEFTAMFDRQKRSPVLDRAPPFLRESLTFPYNYGFAFVQEVAERKGKEVAFAGLLRDPPRNTYQVMHPRSYLAGERMDPLRMPALGSLLGDRHARFDAGAMGALEVLLFLKQFAGEGTARKLARKWRGGFYYAVIPAVMAKPAGEEKEAVVIPAQLSLLYVSRWASVEDAARFAGAYSAALPKRYLQVTASAAEVSMPGAVTYVGSPRRWSTEEGLVLVEACGDTVLALESFDRATTARLRGAILGGCASRAVH